LIVNYYKKKKPKMQPNEVRQLFYLDPNTNFLNFGSFGATPKTILQHQQALQIQMEADPVHFIIETGPQLLAESRAALGQFIHCAADDVVYVTNPTYAVNIVAKSLNLQPTDEILASNIEYGACDKTWEFYCKKAGATYVRQPITLPLTNEETFVQAFFAGITPNTKLIFLSQITSSTALILPAQAICNKAAQLGIPVFIDGAHVPGHIPLNLQQLNPTYYTGACHKWMMTPKGSSFFYCKKEYQNTLDPAIISWGYQSQTPSHSQFLDYHQFNGTRDYTAFLCIPKALQFMQQHNWQALTQQAKTLASNFAATFSQQLQTQPLAPLHSNFLGQIISTKINCPNSFALHNYLYATHKIQVPVMPQNTDVYIRYSVQPFTTQQNLTHLATAMATAQQQGLWSPIN
jgi:isopenicillin-N epimerase